jgi:HEAT repeat protein
MHRLAATAGMMALLLATGASRAAADAPATQPAAFIPFGADGLDIPPQPNQLQLPARSITLLGQALQDKTSISRVSHAKELASCGPAALTYLIEGLTDADPLVRAECAKSVGLLHEVSATSKVAALARDADPAVRREAVLAAAALGDTAPVTAGLNDDSELVKQAALTVAVTPEQAEQIARMFPKLPDRLQPLALAALGRMRAVRYADLVASQLHAGIAIRAAAVEALGKMKATEQGQAVTALLKDVNPTVRREAMLALANLVPPTSQQSLAITTLNDPDPTVRQAAAQVLQGAPTAEAIAPLRRLLDDPYHPLYLAARQALAVAGKQVIPVAVEMLDNANPRRREDGSYLLGAYDSNAAIDRHIQLLDDSDWGVVAQAAKSLYRLVPPVDVTGPHLLSLLERGDKDTGPAYQSRIDAEAAAFLLAGRLRYAAIITPALPTLPTAPMSPGAPDAVRTAAIWAIGMTAAPSSSTAAKVAAIYRNEFQSPAAVFESLKALINLHDPAGAKIFARWEDPQIARDNACRWMAHYGHDLLTHAHTPYVPLPAIQTPELSIQDWQ